MLVQALTPAMIAWRKRLSFITERFEAANSKQDQLKELPAAASKGSTEDNKAEVLVPGVSPQLLSTHSGPAIESEISGKEKVSTMGPLESEAPQKQKWSEVNLTNQC